MEGSSEMATGGCSNGLLIYMFCLAVFQLPFARLVDFARQVALFGFDLCRPWVGSSMFGGLTAGS